MSAGRVIAVVGAPGTGPRRLANAIATRLQARGIAAVHIAPSMEERRRHQAHVPRHRDDRMALAAAHTRRIEAASDQGIAVTGSTALMTAIDCDLQFADRSLYADALVAQSRYTLTLLSAADSTCTGRRRQASAAVDARVRSLLADAGVPFTVIHGRGDERLANAWNALRSLTADTDTDTATTTRRTARSWAWSCDNCSDPVCEHRLFSDLVAGRR